MAQVGSSDCRRGLLDWLLTAEALSGAEPGRLSQRLNCSVGGHPPKTMGGVKKKSLASMEKSQDSQETEQGQAAPSKGKKGKEKGTFQQKKQFSFLPPRMSDQELLRSLTPLKAITIYATSKALGVNASIASGVLKDLESKGSLRRVGGFSGHGVWAVR